MWTRHSIVIAGLLLTGASAYGQANFAPDPTPRLPAQTGQGLAMEDQDFLTRAGNLSNAEIEAARLAQQKAAEPGLRDLSGQILAQHETFRDRLQQQAASFEAPEPPAEGAPHRWDADIQRLNALEGEAFDREYLSWQLRVHLGLVELYQTQASHSPESELAKFAIVALVGIQQQFGALQELGAKHGLKVDTVGQPPQY